MNSPFEVPRSRESLESKLWRIGGNWFPPTADPVPGLLFVAADFREVHIHLPSNFTTRNHMGITWVADCIAPSTLSTGDAVQNIAAQVSGD